MIFKNYEIKKINIKIKKFILFYGENSGLKKFEIDRLILQDIEREVLKYDEKDILSNLDLFFENILSPSFFNKGKIIIIKRSTDKILETIKKLSEKKIQDVTFILNAELLDNKSKLRKFFEKDKEFVCTAFYPDTNQMLVKLTYDILKKKNISISPSNINLIVNKCNGDREILLTELVKIEFFSKNGKKITSENIEKLTNLVENHSISELIDNCLAKNKKKTISILNENNFNYDDCIMITRSFIIKAKRLLNLSSTFEINKNIDLTISSAKPPIFWKEKEITKHQIYKWKPKEIKKLIYKLSETELQIKKNINNSINLITDFILSQSSSETNS
jgi:DNA polymerase-3 subunit delta